MIVKRSNWDEKTLSEQIKLQFNLLQQEGFVESN